MTGNILFFYVRYGFNIETTKRSADDHHTRERETREQRKWERAGRV
jgi:hypothetical protein